MSIADHNLSHRNRCLKEALVFVPYCQAVEDPLLKPSDVVVLCEPTPYSMDQLASTTADPDMLPSLPDEGARHCIINRFWVSEEDRSRIFLWIPSDKDVQEPIEDTLPSDFFAITFSSLLQYKMAIRKII